MWSGSTCTGNFFGNPPAPETSILLIPVMSGLFLTELSGYDKVTKPCDEYRSMAFTFSGDIAAYR